MDNVLIAGGKGLIGKRLTELLQQNGYSVTYLSRSKGEGSIETFLWDPNAGLLDKDALLNADYIINLTGAPVFDHRWTKEYKEEILASRVNATHLLYEKLKEMRKMPKGFINASAIGIYGANTGEETITEESPIGTDFLAEVTKQWEFATEYLKTIGIRTTKVRIGIVLSSQGGMLEKLETTVKRGMGAALGTGRQYISWIHIDDICRLFIKIIKDDSMDGIYNGVAPNPATNEQLIKAMGEILHRPIILPSVPAFALKLMLGSEMAESVLGGSKVSAAKVLREGFTFTYPELKPALANLYEAKT